MKHVCQVPGPGEALKDTWHCRECGWNWRLNQIVWRWFRDVPAERVAS